MSKEESKEELELLRKEIIAKFEGKNVSVSSLYIR